MIDPIAWGWPQYAILAFLFIGMCVSAAKHGQPYPHPYSFPTTICRVVPVDLRADVWRIFRMSDRPPYELSDPLDLPIDQQYGTGALLILVAVTSGLVGSALTIAIFAARGWMA